ncbi:MAG: shikimate kinase [Clostridia bacterium]|nr:shikimate kinase [Clostridia bacterium]
MKSNIILIGMPSAGKSTLGVLLAKTLGMQFLDTDLAIQNYTGETLQQTINRDGIESFLKIEEKVVSSIKCENHVIATGGSVVFSQKAMESLKKQGKVIFLDVPLREIKNRLNNIKTRGIAMKKGETIDSIFKARLPLYKKYADLTVSAAEKNLETTVENIIKLYEKN